MLETRAPPPCSKRAPRPHSRNARPDSRGQANWRQPALKRAAPPHTDVARRPDTRCGAPRKISSGWSQRDFFEPLECGAVVVENRVRQAVFAGVAAGLEPTLRGRHDDRDATEAALDALSDGL